MSNMSDNEQRSTASSILEYGSITTSQRYELVLNSAQTDDDDDEDEVVVDEEEDSEALDPTTMQLMENMTSDPELVKQMLANMQARFQNFEDILADLRCQLVETHQRDEDILKRMASLNEDIAELHLLESEASARIGAGPGGVGTDHYGDISDYANDPLPPHLPTKMPPPYHK